MSACIEIDLLHSQPIAEVAQYYASRLDKHPKAVSFLAKKFNISLDQAQELAIGFADRTLGTWIPSKRLKSGKEIRQQFIDVGLYKTNGRETLRGYVTVPVRDNQGNIIGIRGYKLNSYVEGPDQIEVGQVTPDSQPSDPLTSQEEMVSAVAENTSSELPTDSQADVNASELQLCNDSLLLTLGDRQYRIRGVDRNLSSYQLKINLMVTRQALIHVDSLDLMKSRSRASFIKAAALELYVDEDIIKKDIGVLLIKLEQYRDEKLKAQHTIATLPAMSDADRQTALAFLESPNLLQQVTEDYEACGITGEKTNKIIGYLAAVSRKLPHPLAIVIQSSSSAGKSSLMDAVLSMVPEEDLWRFSNLSSQSLYYLEANALKNKILAISEDGGIAQVTYSLKLLQSEGCLRQATVAKTDSGRMITQQYTVQGPVALFLTTTATELDEELVNRCLVLTVDESRDQTREIQNRQRSLRTLSSPEAAKAQAAIKQKHHHAQRLLEPLFVNNIYADQLTFANTQTRMRRDHVKYLTLIESIAILHQHQRTIHTMETSNQTIRYINVTRQDVATANQLMSMLLGRILDDLPPPTRTFLKRLHDFVRKQAMDQ